MPQPTHNTVEDGNTLSGGWNSILALTKGQNRLMVLTIISTIIAQGGLVFCLYFGALAISTTLFSSEQQLAMPIIVMLAISAVIGAAGKWWNADISHKFAFALIESIQLRLYDSLERSAPSYILGKRTGALASVATQDSQKMEHFFAHTLGDMFAAVIVPTLCLIILAFIHPWLAVTLIPFAILLSTVPFWLGRQAHAQAQSMGQAANELNGIVTEGLQGRKELLLFHQETHWLQKFTESARRLGHAQTQYANRAGMENAAIELLQAGAVIITTLVGLWLIQHHTIELSQLPIIIVLSGACLIPIHDVTQAARQLGQLKSSAKRIQTILMQQASVSDHGTQDPKHFNVTFKDVSFGYHDQNDEVLDHANCAFEFGKITALVGLSGNGKSTCANLITRFWDVKHGAIEIGDINIKSIPLSTLRDSVALVSQETYLFNDTIENNLKMARPNATQYEIHRACRMAFAHEFIMELPAGYQSLCGERGSALSGGQKQRLAIARAILKGSPIMIFDEASSNLDSDSENKILACLKALKQDHNIILIAHRASTINIADQVLELNQKTIQLRQV